MLSKKQRSPLLLIRSLSPNNQENWEEFFLPIGMLCLTGSSNLPGNRHLDPSGPLWRRTRRGWWVRSTRTCPVSPRSELHSRLSLVRLLPGNGNQSMSWNFCQLEDIYVVKRRFLPVPQSRSFHCWHPGWGTGRAPGGSWTAPSPPESSLVYPGWKWGNLAHL